MSEPSHTAQRVWDLVSGNRQRFQGLALALAAFWFAAGLIWAAWTFPGSLKLQPWPLALLLACVPLMTAVNTAEFLVMCRVAGARVGWFASLETTVYASAANMLPIPGSVIARIVALKVGGVSIRFGAMISFLFAGIWGGTAFCYSGIWLYLTPHEALGAIFFTSGLVLFGICGVAARRLEVRQTLLVQAFAVRLAFLLVDILRQMLAIWSLGTLIGFGEASIFAVSGFAGSAVSFVPAGLGIREFVVAALSPLIALPPAVGFLSATVNRMAGMVGLAVLSAILFIRRRNAPGILDHKESGHRKGNPPSASSAATTKRI